MIKAIFGLCLLLVVVFPLSAQPLTQEDVDPLITELGHKDFSVRKKASQKLSQIVNANPEVSGLLLKHLQHPDPEVRMRIQEALKGVKVLLKWVDPAKEGAISSLRAPRGAVSLEFKNASSKPIQIYWLDFDGKRQSRHDSLAPGAVYHCRRSYESHVWLVTDSAGKGLGIYVVGKDDARILYAGPPGVKDSP